MRYGQMFGLVFGLACSAFAAAPDVLPIDAAKGAILYGGFTVKLKIDLGGVKGDEPLYEAGSAKLAIRMAGRDKALERYDLAQGNYLSFPMPDGTCPVLEATIVEQAGRVGVPLGALANAGGVHEVTLDFSPVKWSILVDGLADEAVPVPACPVKWPDNAVQRKFSDRVKSVSFLTPSRHDEVFAEPDAKPIGRSLQYWTPDGFNTWVGDVAPAFLGGKLHVFYLLDRRHHGGGCGTGRHQFAHLATDDLVHWVEHPLAVPITEPWQTVGTGTPFLKDGKLAIAFGWHTSRYPEMKGMPLGGTYAVSDDGIRFRNSGKIISDAQNPSIYNRADGSYELVTSYGGSIGIFRSRDLLRWDLFDDKLPFRGDCPSLFDWHGHRYLLQGFVNMAYSPDGKPGSFVNWTKEPDKLYDGLGVPMVVPWKGDRRLYIGWLNHVYGWGGWLVFREVVAYPDGHLGLKWVPEIEPPVPPRIHSVKAGGNLALRFKNQGGGADLVFTIDAKARTASFADDVPDVKFEEARTGNNFRIGGLRGLEGDYDVRIIRYYDAKAGATIFDAEIAGQRTLVCRRRGQYK